MLISYNHSLGTFSSLHMLFNNIYNASTTNLYILTLICYMIILCIYFFVKTVGPKNNNLIFKRLFYKKKIIYVHGFSVQNYFSCQLYIYIFLSEIKKMNKERIWYFYSWEI